MTTPSERQDAAGARPRVRPCASCPYRRSVPSGVWDASEYAKLSAYDAPTLQQPAAVFMCHQQDGSVCSGWLGRPSSDQLLGLRIGVITGQLDPACAGYTTDVPLFPTGAEAAAHGMRQIADPPEPAREVISKLIRQRMGRPRPR